MNNGEEILVQVSAKENSQEFRINMYVHAGMILKRNLKENLTIVNAEEFIFTGGEMPRSCFRITLINANPCKYLRLTNMY